MEAQRGTAQMALTLIELDREGPRIIRKEGLVEKLYRNSESAEGDMPIVQPTFSWPNHDDYSDKAGCQRHMLFLLFSLYQKVATIPQNNRS